MEKIINREEIYNFLKSNTDVRSKLVNAVERVLIEESLIMHRGNQTKAAQASGICRAKFRAKMKEFGIADEVV